jgi:predicted Ser/Thr protein kinase
VSETTPKKFGRFEAEGVIGKGGMGVVHRARDHVIGRAVAIKVLRTEEGVGSPAHTALVSRFEQEFRSAGTLSHPSLVTIYDVGQEGDLTYIAMELVEGPSLQRLLESGQNLSLDEVLTITQDLSEGLDHAHAAGIIHRDIKPANILFTKEQRAKITDFGVAKVRSMDITMTGTLVGTPGYMSPEQILGKKVTGASDQFSLAVMVYQMLTGRLPFHGNEPATVLYKIAHEEPQPPHLVNTNLPPTLSPVLLRALSKDPQERYATCSEMARQLRHAAGRDTARFVPQGVAGETLAFDSSSLAGPMSGMNTVRNPKSDVIVHRPATPRLGTQAGTYAGAGSWWQRQPTAGRAGIVAAAAVAIALAGWLAFDAFSKGDTPAPSDETAEAARTATTPSPEPPAPEPRMVTIHSEPPGATVRLDGQALPNPTPVNVELMPGQTYDLELRLQGYRTASREGLAPESLERQVLSFELEPVPPPGQLVVRASYPVELRVDGRPVEGAPSLEEGSYQVVVSAPSVLYQETRRVQIRSGQATTIDLPGTTKVRIIAIPANAEVSVDGSSRMFEPPFDLEVVQDTEHSFRFVWPDGRVQQQRIVVGSGVRQILGSPTQVETRG